MPPTGDLPHNSGMCRNWEQNWQPFGSQASAQSTEPHQPGKKDVFLKEQLMEPWSSNDHIISENLRDLVTKSQHQFLFFLIAM